MFGQPSRTLTLASALATIGCGAAGTDAATEGDSEASTNSGGTTVGSDGTSTSGGGSSGAGTSTTTGDTGSTSSSTGATSSSGSDSGDTGSTADSGDTGTGDTGSGDTGGQTLCSSGGGTAPTGALTATRVTAADPGDDDDHLYEGALWHEGALWYSDFTGGGSGSSWIRKLVLPGTVTIARESAGTNGLADDGIDILAADHGRQRITRFPAGAVADTGESAAAEYDSAPFNSPNDLTVGSDGTIYFTDPDFQRAGRPGQDTTSVYRVAAGDGQVTLVDDTLQNPNGIALSLLEDTLYVAGGNVLRRYPIASGVPGEGDDIVTDLSAPDGLTLDCLGNVYATEHSNGRVRVFTPDGEELATIALGQTIRDTQARATNVAFGGPEGRTLFVTGSDSLWQIELAVAGRPY